MGGGDSGRVERRAGGGACVGNNGALGWLC